MSKNDFFFLRVLEMNSRLELGLWLLKSVVSELFFFRIGVIAAVLNYAGAIPDMSRARERWMVGAMVRWERVQRLGKSPE